MRPLPVAATALLALAPFLLAAGPLGKPKPASSASVSAPSAASSGAVVVSVPSSSVAPAVGSTALSPLTPRPDEAPPVKAEPSTMPSGSYDDLMADIANLRARVGVIAKAVWKSHISVSLRATGSHAGIAAAKLFVDGAQVWTLPKALSFDDPKSIFDGGVAAGLHAVSLEVERRDDRDPTFRTIQRTTATVVVPQGKTVVIEARIDDDSDMGDEYTSDGEGEYDGLIRLNGRAVNP